MAVCRKSSDATNVRWEPCAPDQGPDRDSPLGYLIASGIFVASYRAVPVRPYLGARALILKRGCERFEALRERFGARGQYGVRSGRHGSGGSGFGLGFDQLISKQQRCEQELPR